MIFWLTVWLTAWLTKRINQRIIEYVTESPEVTDTWSTAENFHAALKSGNSPQKFVAFILRKCNTVHFQARSFPQALCNCQQNCRQIKQLELVNIPNGQIIRVCNNTSPYPYQCLLQPFQIFVWYCEVCGGTRRQFSAIAHLHRLEFTVAHALGLLCLR
jgi:hypothetical protein